MTAIIEGRVRSFDTHPVLPSGIAPVPIQRRLDYKHATRDEITQENIQFDQGEYRFFGNPNGFPKDTVPLSPIHGQRGILIRNPANYFRRGVLAVAANSPMPTEEEIARAKETKRIIDTVYITDLLSNRLTLDVFTANFLGAFLAGVDIAESDPKRIKPVGIVHHTPVTGELKTTLPGTTHTQKLKFPRSVSYLHGTVGYAHTDDLATTQYEPTRSLLAERSLLTEEVLLDLTGRIEHGLAERGFDQDSIQVNPRGEPHGVDIHLMDLTPDNLISREGLALAADIFVAISQIYAQAAPVSLGHLPPFINFEGETFYTSPVPAHRQVFHMHDGHAVYGLIPVPIGTSIGGGESSNYKPDRSAEYSYTPAQLREVEIYSTEASQTAAQARRNLGLAA